MLTAIPFIGTTEKVAGTVVKQESVRQIAEGKKVPGRLTLWSAAA